MIHPFARKFMDALAKCFVDNGDGTFTVDSVAVGSSSTAAGTGNYVRTSVLQEEASKLFTDDGDGTFRLKIR